MWLALLTLLTPIFALDSQWQQQWLATHFSAEQLQVRIRAKRDLAPEIHTNGLTARKCCDIDQVFHFTNHQLSCQILESSASVMTFKEITKTLWFKKKNITITVSTGFTKCDPALSIQLQPELIPSDRFYLNQDGELILPHRFWKFSPDAFCMEDFAEDKDPRNYLRNAFVCVDQIGNFPLTVVDTEGKFHLSPFNDPYLFENRTVVRKCCDFNSAFWAERGQCLTHPSLASNPLINTLIQNESILIRVGNLDCENLEITPLGPNTSALPFELLPNGKISLFHRTRQIVVNSENYCLDTFIYSSDQSPIAVTQAWYCPPQRIQKPSANNENETSSLSVPKCCLASQVLVDEQCQNLPNSQFEQQVEMILLNNLDHAFSHDPTYLEEGPWVPTCSARHLVAISSLSFPTFYRENGQLIIELLLDHNSYNLTCHGPTHRITVASGDFCLDLAYYFSNTTSEYVPTLSYCAEFREDVTVHVAYPVLLFISALALIATFLIYLLAPAQAMARIIVNPRARHRSAVRLRSQVRLAETLFGKTLLCHIVSLAFSFIMLGLAQLRVTLPGANSCTALGLLVYFGFMASFVWLSIICFDLWWQFRTPIRLPDEFRFIPYSVLGWGGPIIATAIAWAAQMNPDWMACPFQPYFGLRRCWFHSDTALWAFFYGPISALLALNTLFFTLLCYNLKVFSCLYKPSDDNTQDPLGQRNVYLATELFLIMGIPWILEILAWLPSLRDRTQWYRYLWEITNILNLLRGFLLFLIFIVLKPKVRRYLWSQCRPNRKKATRKHLSIKTQISNISKGSEIAQVTWHSGPDLPFDLSPASSSHPGRLKQRHVSELSNFSMASVNTNVSTICTTPMNEPTYEAAWSSWNSTQEITETLQKAISETEAEITYL